MPTLYEKHWAVVTDTGDPEKRGRLKVKCQSLIAADHELPEWVETGVPLFTSAKGAAFWLPEVEDTVEIEIAITDTRMDDRAGERFLQNPTIRWRPAACTDQDGAMPLPGPFKTNYGKKRGFVTPSGHCLVFDDTDGQESIILLHAKGGKAIFDEKNGITLETKDHRKITMGNSSNKITIEAQTIELKGGVVLIGDGADGHITRYEELSIWANNHTHSTTIGPTGIPVAPLPETAKSPNNKVK